MKLISARQAWHDCFYQGGGSLTQSVLEIAELGKLVQKSERDSSTSMAAHLATAGKVQAAIATLTPSLRGFGNWMYSPLATRVDENLAHALVWFTAEAKLPDARRAKFEKCYFMTLAALRSHQAAALGRSPWTIAMICSWLLDTFAVKISEQHWARDWQDVWNVLAKTIDQLDAQALAPVAAAVYGQREDRAQRTEQAAELVRKATAGGVTGKTALVLIAGRTSDGDIEKVLDSAFDANDGSEQALAEIEALEALLALERKDRWECLKLTKKEPA